MQRAGLSAVLHCEVATYVHKSFICRMDEEAYGSRLFLIV